MIRTITAALVVSALGGCSSGSGGGSTSGPLPTPPPDERADGIWEGTVTQQGGTVVNQAFCVIAVTDEFACLLVDPENGALAGASAGTISVSGNNATLSGTTVYTTQGYVLADGSRVALAQITGTVSEKNSISLSGTVAGASLSGSVAYDDSYERGSSLATVAGVYSDFYINTSPASLSIDSDGSLFGQAANGCVANGQVEIIDSQYNAYAVSGVISSCGALNGQYSGLGVTLDWADQDDLFLFAVFGPAGPLLAAPVR